MHEDNVPAFILALMLYSWATIPFIYLPSFCFHYEGSAFVKLIIILTFLSIGPLILILVTSEKGEDRLIYTYLSFFRSQPRKTYP